MVDIMRSITDYLGVKGVYEIVSEEVGNYIRNNSPKLKAFRYKETKIREFIEKLIKQLKGDTIMDKMSDFQNEEPEYQDFLLFEVANAIRHLTSLGGFDNDTSLYFDWCSTFGLVDDDRYDFCNKLHDRLVKDKLRIKCE